MRTILGLLIACIVVLGQPRTFVVENRAFRFEALPSDGSYRLRDKETGVVWSSAKRFGRIGVIERGRRVDYPLAAFKVATETLTFHPIANRTDVWVRISARAVTGGRTLELGYDASPELEIADLRLLDESFPIASVDHGYVVVPVREGLLIPPQGPAFARRFNTGDPEGCHMNMLGLVKRRAALLVTWTDPYVSIEIGRAGQNIATSALLSNRKSTLRLEVLGTGDYNTIAAAYRRIAKARGLVVTTAAKIRQNPERARYLGASNVKLWQALQRRMDESSTRQISLNAFWTFSEVAQVAEHLKNDLQMDKVLLGLGGWTRRGYDNQHPDILPAAPELGGDAGFADCARRVMALGYLFSPHDNYQDMYRDAPSWNEDWIMKLANGSLAKGGVWNGGRAFLICSRRALELARRPQNLPAVEDITHANAYFLDTTYASGLFECFDPEHPLRKADDLRYKIALSDYTRGLFGSLGSEDGREWAIPHADYFEGITGVAGEYFSDRNLLTETGAIPIPLFELVFHDCIAAFGKYGYDEANSAHYVLEHMLLGRTLNYHNLPAHLYWRNLPDPAHSEPSGDLDPGYFQRAGGGWAEGMHPQDRFMKNTHEVLSPLNEITGTMQMVRHEFLSTDRKVQRTRFTNGTRNLEVVVNFGSAKFEMRSNAGGSVELPAYGFLIESPEYVAFRAVTWAGRRYDDTAPVFTLRSLDGKPLVESARVRIFHAMGDSRLEFRGPRMIPHEEILTFH